MAKQITTFIEDKPGALANFCSFLKENDIDMRAMNVSDAQCFGIVRVIVNDVNCAYEILKNHGFVCQIRDVLVIEVKDHAGALVELLKILGDSGVNLEYTYALFSRHEGTAGFVIKTNDRKKAFEALTKAGVHLLTEDEI